MNAFKAHKRVKELLKYYDSPLVAIALVEMEGRVIKSILDCQKSFNRMCNHAYAVKRHVLRRPAKDMFKFVVTCTGDRLHVSTDGIKSICGMSPIYDCNETERNYGECKACHEFTNNQRTKISTPPQPTIVEEPTAIEEPPVEYFRKKRDTCIRCGLRFGLTAKVTKETEKGLLCQFCVKEDLINPAPLYHS